MIVVPHRKSLSDQVADHRAGPHPRCEPRRLRTRVDHQTQLVALSLGQSRSAPRWFPRSETICPGGLEPLQPPIDGPSGHIQLGAEGNDRSASKVTGHRSGPPPGVEVACPFGFPVKTPKSPPFLGAGPSLADCLAVLRPPHDRPPTGRDRGTLILARSSVNRRRMDPLRRDPV